MERFNLLYDIDEDLNLHKQMSFTPRTCQLTLQLNTTDKTIHNMMLECGDKLYYMVRDGNSFKLNINKLFAHSGLNIYRFVVEKEVDGELKKRYSEPLEIELSEENISKDEVDNLELLKREIARTIRRS